MESKLFNSDPSAPATRLENAESLDPLFGGNKTTNASGLGITGNRGNLTEWEIILIASISAGMVILITILAVLWKICKKSSHHPTVQTRTVAPAPASSGDERPNNGKSRFSCCPQLTGSRRCSAHDHAHTAATTKEQTDGKEQSTIVQQDNNPPFQMRTPLPPIGDETSIDYPVRFGTNRHSMPSDPVSFGRTTIPPRRLAPLNEHTKVITTGLTGGTVVRRANSYGPVHHNSDLRGTPPFSGDQWKPSPPPPE